MHLKSTGGPIDVLVCPEAEETRPSSPCLQHSDIPAAMTPASCDEQESTPHKLITSQDSSVAGLMSMDENDISLSSIADVAPEELDCLLQYGTSLCQMDTTSCLMPSFETLSPPLQEGDFNFGLDVTEGIGDLFDL